LAHISKKNIQEGKDIFTVEERSKIMAKIGQLDTKPEILLRKRLHKAGLRFRKNVKNLPGTPDVVLPKYKTVIFIHGCFWHRHHCRKGRSMPNSRQDFWNEKFNKNISRDLVKNEQLSLLGWHVLVIWECELKKIDDVVNHILTYLSKVEKPSEM